ncbi:uncharacterized protein LOC117322890 isoform X2 [Pecten maximus]|uniref:uncharacterized protein LOC117322890 isoform X2 n=1 Tax=Pecten maximus TaxID=6579 RepID=UPI0014584C5C|nr:uncharacterized protein LOC117322890 isoform X2 [Pecten maximus]
MIRNLSFIVILVIGFVHSAPSLLPVSEVEGDDLLCNICHLMVGDLKSLIGENATESQVEDKLDDICNRLAADRETCVSMVHQYLPPLFAKISGGIDPESACVELKVCSTSDTSNGTPVMLDINHVISNDIPLEPETESLTENEVDNVIPQYPHPYSGRKGKPVNIKQKLDSNETCQICEFLIQVLDASIATNQTEAAINKTILQICAALPAELSSFCKSITPALINILDKGIDPEKGCVTLRLCQSTVGIVNMKSMTCDMCRSSMKEAFGKAGEKACFEIRGMCKSKKAGSNAHRVPVIYEGMEEVSEGKMATIPNEEDEHVEANPLECELCKVLVYELNKVLITNQTDEDINATVYKICDEAPDALHGICFTYAPQIVNLLENGFDSAIICKLVRACSAAVSVQEEEEPEQIEANPLECELCKMLVDELDQVLANNRSEAVINSTIYQLCGEVPGAMKNYCMTYAPRIVQLLETGFDPSAVCTQLRACSAAVSVQEEEEPEQIEANPLECELCKMLVDELDQVLANNRSEAVINSTIYQLCGEVPGAMKNYCMTYAPRIVQLLETGFDPSAVCTQLRACSGAVNAPVEEEGVEPAVTNEKEEKEGLEDIIKDLLPNEVTNLEDAKCDICKAIIAIIDRYLDSNQTKDAINDTVYGLCSNLPGDFQQLCDNVAPQVVLAVESGLDPSSACTFVKLCTGDSFEVLSEEIEDKVKDVSEDLEDGDTKCELCKLVINLVDQYIGRNTSEEGLNDTVYKLCGLLPGDVKSTCDFLAPDLVKAMDSGFDPTRACSVINFCANVTMVEMYDEETEQEEPEEEMPQQRMPPLTGYEGIRAEIEKTIMKNVEGFGDDKCDICQFVITLFDKYMEKNTSQVAINNTVYELCGFLPGDIKTTCNLFAPQLVKAMDSGFDPERGCEAVRLCTNGTSLVIMEPGLAIVDPIVEPVIQEEEPMEDVEAIIEEAEPRSEEAEPIEDIEEEPEVEEEEPRGEEVDEEPRSEEVEEEPRSEEIEEEQRVEEEEPRGEETEQRYEEVEPRGEETEQRYEEVEPRGEETELRYEEVEPRGEEVEAIGEDVEPIVGEETRETGILPEEEQTLQLEEERRPVEFKENYNIEEPENVNADARCELCELMIGILDRYINMNSTHEKLNQTVFSLCTVLPAQLKSTCLLIAPKLTNTIEAGLDPETTCTVANFCVNGTEIEFPVHVPGLTCEACHSIVELVNTERYDLESADIICASTCSRRHRRSVSESSSPSRVQERTSVVRKEVLRGDPVWACDVCEFIVKAVNVYLTDNKTMEEVTDHLMTLCSYFPDPYAQTCKNSVTVVVEEFDSGIDVTELCNIDNGNKCGKASQDIELLFDTLGKPEDWECNICKHALSTMNGLLDQDYEQIKMYMGGVCERLSVPHNQQCHVFIQMQSEQVFNRIIEKLLSPTQVCQLAGVCSVKPQIHPGMSKTNPNSTTR